MPSSDRAGSTPGRATRLLSNRNFTLLWLGDTLSEFGSQATSLAMPLLVLALTGSPGRAGLVGLARGIAYPLAPLPAGVLVDRLDRRRLMIACAAGRALAMASVVVALAVGRPPLAQLMAVAFVNAALWSTGMNAERSLLTAVVDPEQLPDAVALNEARESVAVVGGPALGGALFGLSRGLPFLADAVSFVASAVAAAAVRAPRATRAAVPEPAAGADTGADAGAGGDARPFAGDVLAGAAWLWRRPFLRAGALLYAAANVTLGAIELLAVLIARHHGAGSAATGVAFVLIGAGGVAGALLAGPARRRLTTRVAVLLEPWFSVLFVPLLLVARAPWQIGLVCGAELLPVALSSSVIVGRRLTDAPDHLRGRVQAAAGLLSSSLAWLGPLGVGQLYERAGESATVLALVGWTLAVGLAAAASSGLRDERPAAG